ncbi:sugar phosphorylase [uncultured Umboniibacter sp.]|uniref:sugar phosphorylase n=1 Tax=uncultured Umboniibacter sp. TaxID=1798917 RepID=UPI00260715B3|nr:sugar phosphorylase [uncultured Umboniibacter sp.]
MLNPLRLRLEQHLSKIYRDIEREESISDLATTLLQLMRLEPCAEAPRAHHSLWDQRDIALICYGDSLLANGEKPLHTLAGFLEDHLSEAISMVHILPFFPWTSDDGFAVQDYTVVNDFLGDWDDIAEIAANFKLMGDLVINHGSSHSVWFENFKRGLHPGKDFYFTALPTDDLSKVVRPRTSPLLQRVDTVEGPRWVWCTFSHDQVDFDFRNPEVLKAFVEIIRLHLDKGVRVFRLDAVAFLWKQVGSSSINLTETHELVRLLRTLIEHAADGAMIITETNIPNEENLAYFGNANEAHAIYNFSLPPLLVYSLISGDSHYLRQWLMTLPPAQFGTTYFNFLASHDGIGLRPVEGLLSDDEVDAFIRTMERSGGLVSWRAGAGGVRKAYEINITLMDALQGTVKGHDEFGFARFICAHAVMLALEGIPAIYIHSLLGTRNDHLAVERLGYNRAINRHQWDYEQLIQHLSHPESPNAKVVSALKVLITLRKLQPSFHPNATQYTLQLGPGLFGFWRQSNDRRQSIFCLYNLTGETQRIPVSELNLVVLSDWYDLITDEIIAVGAGELEFQPYAFKWVSNRQ